MNFTDFAPLAPEIFIVIMACVILLADLYITAWRALSYTLAQATLIGAAYFSLSSLSSEPMPLFDGMFIDDRLSDVLKVAIYATAVAVFVYSRRYLAARGMYRGEFYVLGLFGVLGMMVMVSAGNFLTLYLGLELLSLSLYAMVAFQRDSAVATEAAMKYFVLGALASGMLLYGISMLYGATGSLDMATVQQRIAQSTQQPLDMVLVFGLVFVVVGIAFKLGAAPFHMWIPDVYHGAPTAVTLYVGTIPKLAAFAMVMRVLVGALPELAPWWRDMLAILAVLSMATGNIIAIAQSNLKRMLAYSTISHMGFFLIGILSGTPNGYSASMFYVIAYAVMGLGAFGMIMLLSRAGFEADRLEDLKGLNQRSPWYAFLMLLLMFSMAGVPPTIGFFAKLSVIQAVIDGGQIWLAIVAVMLSVIGAYYYLRIVKLMYFDAPTDASPIAAAPDFKVLLSANALATVLLAPWVGSLMALCQAAVAGA